MNEETAIYVTEADLLAQRDEECARIGVAWDEIAGWVDECGCCISVPESHAHLAEAYVEHLWWTFRA